MNLQIQWSDLGNPTQPGTYIIRGVGEVTVTQEDIDEAVRLGGTPQIEILETTTFGHNIKQYIVGHFIP